MSAPPYRSVEHTEHLLNFEFTFCDICFCEGSLSSSFCSSLAECHSIHGPPPKRLLTGCQDLSCTLIRKLSSMSTAHLHVGWSLCLLPGTMHSIFFFQNHCDALQDRNWVHSNWQNKCSSTFFISCIEILYLTN